MYWIHYFDGFTSGHEKGPFETYEQAANTARCFPPSYLWHVWHPEYSKGK